ncbi:hypothetical protein [Blastococcus sp. TF02-09]|uniref:hypothetical protein n=1 Tax=Blastococcus sp. TF02-09 TaxID=2250576 RepID=UPI0018F4CB77|nr:hypothetical protein [Blastococcus sp. TF02-9]
MPTTRSAAGRCSRLLAAAALVTVITACGPVDVIASAPDAGTSAPTSAAGAAVADVPASPPVEPAPEQPVGTAPIDEAPAVSEPVDREPVPPSGPQADESSAPATTRAAEPGPQVPLRSAAAAGPSAEAPEPSTGSGQVHGASLATPVALTASSGAGGSYTDQQRTAFTATNGKTGRFLRYAGGIDPSRPVGLVVYADGTGEYGVDNPSSSYALGGSSGLIAVARNRNMVTLAVESPDQSCECWHTGDTSRNADFLAELIEKQLRSYPISEVWLVGFSSGAQEITRFLVPRHPELLRLGGGWVVFGGGGPAAESGSKVTAQRMAGVRGHWFTGTADTAVPLTASWGAAAGERWYGARGVRTSHDWASGVGHSLDGRLGRTVARLLDEG